MSNVFDLIPPIVCPGCNKIVAQIRCVDGTRAAILCRRCKQRVIVIADNGHVGVGLEGELVKRHNLT